MMRLRIVPVAGVFSHFTVIAVLFAPDCTPCYRSEEPKAADAITSPLGKKLVLKFQDEFDAVKDIDGEPYIDRSKWQTTFWQGSSARSLLSNLEAQYYVDKDYNGDGSKPGEVLNPFSFAKPGILTISALRVPERLWTKFWMSPERCFASGLLISDKRFNFQYGYVEGRFKLPPIAAHGPPFGSWGTIQNNSRWRNNTNGRRRSTFSSFLGIGPRSFRRLFTSSIRRSWGVSSS